jgi:hypothetical protein
MRFAPPKLHFGWLSRGNIHHCANDLDAPGAILLSFSDNVQILDPSVGKL